MVSVCIVSFFWRVEPYRIADKSRGRSYLPTAYLLIEGYYDKRSCGLARKKYMSQDPHGNTKIKISKPPSLRGSRMGEEDFEILNADIFCQDYLCRLFAHSRLVHDDRRRSLCPARAPVEQLTRSSQSLQTRSYSYQEDKNICAAHLNTSSTVIAMMVMILSLLVENVSPFRAEALAKPLRSCLPAARYGI